VRVEHCEAPTLAAQVKHCDLFGLDEEAARAGLIAFLTPADARKRGAGDTLSALVNNCERISATENTSWILKWAKPTRK